ncbi:hypothetical protein M1D80_09525 [Phyllobacteriaceae bacterium JZ32]
MSLRGRRLFELYVANYLNHPLLAGVGLDSHAFALAGQARAQAIPMHEVTDEVGPLLTALAAAVKK